jgi:type IX secretion system PorP/SprF family membrane protein
MYLPESLKQAINRLFFSNCGISGLILGRCFLAKLGGKIGEMKKLLLTALLGGAMTCLQAQDVRFTQFYQAPVYLNPAFTGASGAARAGINYRKQGNSEEAAYTTFSAYADYYFKDFYASAGLLFISDEDAYSGYISQTVAVPLSYDFSINKKVTVKPALQASYTRQGIDFSKFLFSDQIDSDGNVSGGGTSEPLAVNDRISFFDVSAGVLTYGANWWFGYSMHNMLENNISFVEGGNATLPIRYSVHGGVSVSLAEKGRKSRSKLRRFVMPTFNYVAQGGFSQLDAGAILQYEPILFGALYRGIPNPFSEGEYSAVSWIIGVTKFDFSVGYSYDMPLNNRINPGGVHEISISLLFDPSDPNATPRSAKRLKCPIPY